jgi:hypothetical protein
MREYLELEFGALRTTLSFPFDIEKIIDDWVSSIKLRAEVALQDLTYMYLERNGKLCKDWQLQLCVAFCQCETFYLSDKKNCRLRA